MNVRTALTSAIACIVSLAALASAANATTANQCLSPAERSSAAKLATVMGIGVALQRCGKCMGSEAYAEAVKNYDAAGLDDEFEKSQKTFANFGDKFPYVDVLVRDAAREVAAGMSSNCQACSKLSSTLKGLTSEGERGDFYERETAALSTMKESESCQ
jgi:hypothetical protein